MSALRTALGRVVVLCGPHRVAVMIVFFVVFPWLMPYKALAINVLILGLFAVGFNIVFGYTGLLSFGHAAFFGMGAYGCGIAIARYGLPWPLALGAGVLLAGVGAVLIGGLSIRRRGIYFAMVTLALAQCVYYIFYQAESITGGENGLRGVDVRTIALGPVALDFLAPTVKYYFVLVFVSLALWCLSRVLESPFGAVLEAIRENETRARACGFDVDGTKLAAFVLSGLFCGLAGGLKAMHLSIVPTEVLHYQTSGLVVIMALLGGMGTFFGPFVGAAVFLLIEDQVSLVTAHWQLVAGSLFMVFVLFFPNGIWGSLLQWVGRAP